MSLIEVTIRAFGQQVNIAVADDIEASDVLERAQTKVLVINETLTTDDVVGNVQDILSDIEFILDAGFTAQDVNENITSFFAPPQTVLPVNPINLAIGYNVDVSLNQQPSAGMYATPYAIADMSNETEGEIFWVAYADDTYLNTEDFGLWNLGGGLASVMPDTSNNTKISFGSTTRRDIPAITVDDYDVPTIWNIRAKSNEWVLTKNGVTIHQDLVNTVQFPASPYVFQNTASAWFYGYLGVMICCNKVQTAVQRAAILNYLSKRFNIAVSPTAFGISYTATPSDTVAVSDAIQIALSKHITVSDTAVVTDANTVISDQFQLILGSNLAEVWHAEDALLLSGVVYQVSGRIASTLMQAPSTPQRPGYTASNPLYNNHATVDCYRTDTRILRNSGVSGLIATGNRPFMWAIGHVRDVGNGGITTAGGLIASRSSGDHASAIRTETTRTDLAHRYYDGGSRYSYRSPLASTRMIFGTWRDGTRGSALWRNGILVDLNAAGTAANSGGISDLCLGADWNAGEPENFSCAAWGICTNAPTHDELEALWRYANAEYGLDIVLYQDFMDTGGVDELWYPDDDSVVTSGADVTSWTGWGTGRQMLPYDWASMAPPQYGLTGHFKNKSVVKIDGDFLAWGDVDTAILLGGSTGYMMVVWRAVDAAPGNQYVFALGDTHETRLAINSGNTQVVVATSESDTLTGAASGNSSHITEFGVDGSLARAKTDSASELTSANASAFNEWIEAYMGYDGVNNHKLQIAMVLIRIGWPTAHERERMIDLAQNAFFEDAAIKNVIIDDAIAVEDITYTGQNFALDILGSNLKAWWVADSGVSHSSGVVSQWVDKIGGLELITIGSGTNVTYGADGSNFASKSVVQWGTNGKRLETPTVEVIPVSSRPYVFCSYRYRDAATGAYGRTWHTNNDMFVRHFISPADPKEFFTFNMPGHGAYSGVIHTGAYNTNQHFEECWFDGTLVHFRLDGVDSTAASTSSTGNALNVVRVSETSPNSGNGSMYTLGMCQSVPTAAQMWALTRAVDDNA